MCLEGKADGHLGPSLLGQGRRNGTDPGGMVPGRARVGQTAGMSSGPHQPAGELDLAAALELAHQLANEVRRSGPRLVSSGPPAETV
jgi:hypothetical protein